MQHYCVCATHTVTHYTTPDKYMCTSLASVGLSFARLQHKLSNNFGKTKAPNHHMHIIQLSMALSSRC